MIESLRSECSTYIVSTGVGLRKKGRETVLVATPPQVLGNDTVGHLEGKGERGRGSRGATPQFLHQTTAQLRLRRAEDNTSPQAMHIATHF